MALIKEKISPGKFAEIVGDADMVKVVVDIEREIVALGCELHIDCANELIEDGSRSKDIWGANVYPKKREIDFTAVFNIKPSSNNRSLEIQDAAIREKVGAVIQKFLPL